MSVRYSRTQLVGLLGTRPIQITSRSRPEESRRGEVLGCSTQATMVASNTATVATNLSLIGCRASHQATIAVSTLPPRVRRTFGSAARPASGLATPLPGGYYIWPDAVASRRGPRPLQPEVRRLQPPGLNRTARQPSSFRLSDTLAPPGVLDRIRSAALPVFIRNALANVKPLDVVGRLLTNKT